MSIERNKQNSGVQILLDYQKNQHESLLSAASLARKFKLELQGLFIEEEDQIRAADLSFSREISRWSAEERQISGESVHRILRAHARLKQKELENVANSAKVDCSFQVIRGERIRWIKENINTAEILFLGAHKLASKRFQSFRYCTEVTPPLLTIFDGSVSSERAFKIAMQIAENNKKPLLVILLVGEFSEEQQIKDKINILLLKASNIVLRIKSVLRSSSPKAILQIQAQMLIIPSDIEWAQNEKHLEKLIEQVRCPIVFVQ